MDKPLVKISRREKGKYKYSIVCNGKDWNVQND